MKIYFGGSIKGGREKQEDYFELINFIGKYGTVLTEHIGNVNTNINEEVKYSSKEDEHVYIRDTKWLESADLVIADVSIPSLGVGYEIGYAESKNIPVVCLYDNNSVKSLSYMLSGNNKNTIIRYDNLEDVKNKLEIYFKEKTI